MLMGLFAVTSALVLTSPANAAGTVNTTAPELSAGVSVQAAQITPLAVQKWVRVVRYYDFGKAPEKIWYTDGNYEGWLYADISSIEIVGEKTKVAYEGYIHI